MQILVLKRIDDKYAQFDWLEDLNLDDSTFYDKLKFELVFYLNGNKKLKFKISIPNFYEESNQVKLQEKKSLIYLNS